MFLKYERLSINYACYPVLSVALSLLYFVTQINRQRLLPVNWWTGWMDDLRFYALFTVFQAYQDDTRVIMNGGVQRNPV